ncbi:hypothetical protein HBB16_07185 [Pseudonocardia sp. MCCB 268]|nr:hypothetical protein [Pseudonocardia cytotoxica]
MIGAAVGFHAAPESLMLVRSVGGEAAGRRWKIGSRGRRRASSPGRRSPSPWRSSGRWSRSSDRGLGVLIAGTRQPGHRHGLRGDRLPVDLGACALRH